MRCTRPAGSSTWWPTRPARCCRAPGSPPSSSPSWASPHRVVVDGAGPSVIARGLVDAVVVGADRIAANGDVANKIGTYPLALAAARAGIPFVVAAPESTVDPATPDGAAIEIEERAPDEVLAGGPAWNPAFDVTPADLVTAVVTERRVWRAGCGDKRAVVIEVP